jgi:RimJ/RimL family protein N-acetyltransferase
MLRGRGLGQQVMNALLKYAFENLSVHTVELNVFTWNIAGIKCYEKVGFSNNPSQESYFEVNGNTWIGLNMTMTRKIWDDLFVTGHNSLREK